MFNALSALGLATACTQLFGGERDTLAPIPSKAPITTSPMFAQPAPGGGTICETGDMRCEGALLQTCADDRSSWVTVQHCAAAALCQENPATCLAATCGAEEMSCSGAVLQKCNVDRTGWELFATCLSPAHCNADLRQCTTEPCTPGERRCDRSEVDQSPVLEVCRDDRMDWGPLDACVTRQLCDQTLTSGGLGELVLGSDGMLQAPTSAATVLKCNLPACALGEVKCDGSRLEFCSEGRTGWITAEECASPALCLGSLTNVGSAGTPGCLPPACAVGQHSCSAAGVLQVCSDDRTGFRDQEACIGPPFCSAALADQGLAGCREAACEAGQMQCNGAQIQICKDDRTGLDDSGAPCESAALCNADDPLNAFCDEPLCRRGATSGNEFHCEGAQLQRCNESLTVYDTIQTCVTPALCDASQRFNGCKTPLCQPNQHACNAGFLQTCNADQTGFDNTENCGSQAQCDANAGRCADPCEPGATRCNSASGDLEQCRDRLTGWQPIADCQSLALCDAENGRCNICLSGQFSCADNQLRQCASDGRTFARQNIPAECAAAPAGGAGVRACQNNQVVVNSCPFGCTNGRCNECTGTTTQCVGNGQIRRCVNGFFGPPTSCSDGNACNGVESCQNNNCVGGTPLNCNDGNQCSNDSCNPALGCQFAGFSSNFQCINNGGQVQGCSNGQLQTANCSGLGCTAGRCNNCNQGACANGTQFQTCDNGQISGPKNCPANNICQGAGNCVFNCQALNCNDNNACTNDSCSPQSGCVHANNTISCSDGNTCNGSETCGNGTCNRSAAPGNGTACGNGNVCQGGQCGPPPPVCTANQTTRCQNGVPQRCNGQGTGFNDLAACTGNTRHACGGGTTFVEEDCGTARACNNGQCIANQVCTPNAVLSCSVATQTVCNAAGTATAERPCAAGMGCNLLGGTTDCVPVTVIGTGTGTLPPPGSCTPRLERAVGCQDVNTLTCVGGLNGDTTRLVTCPAGTTCRGTACQ